MRRARGVKVPLHLPEGDAPCFANSRVGEGSVIYPAPLAETLHRENQKDRIRILVKQEECSSALRSSFHSLEGESSEAGDGDGDATWTRPP